MTSIFTQNIRSKQAETVTRYVAEAPFAMAQFKNQLEEMRAIQDAWHADADISAADRSQVDAYFQLAVDAANSVMPLIQAGIAASGSGE